MATKTIMETKTVSIVLQMLQMNQWKENHPLQREAEQWNKTIRDGFIVTVARNEDFDSIKLCEEDGINYIIDGKQRLTTIKMFYNNMFAVGKNVEMPMIEYFETDGSKKEFDIRGKKYKDFPQGMKLQFESCQLVVVKQLNCTREETGYHMRRYNHQRQLNSNQTSITYLDKKAQQIKDISSGNRFFIDCGKYTANEKKNGTIDKIVVESAMSTFHLADWKKEASKLGEFVNENVTEEEFETLNDYFKRLTPLCEDKFRSYFNSKNTFIFIALFDRFAKLGLNEIKFVEFMEAFENSLHSKVIDGLSFDKLNENRATKDKSVVTGKIEFLEKLMLDFLHISIENIEVVSDEEFITSVVDIDIESVKEDLSLYNETLDTLIRNSIKDGYSKLSDANNRQSLLAMVCLSFEEDIDLDDWFVDYVARNNMYAVNQKRNFELMKNDLKKYLVKVA